jgi:hypothetical protein
VHEVAIERLVRDLLRREDVIVREEPRGAQAPAARNPCVEIGSAEGEVLLDQRLGFRRSDMPHGAVAQREQASECRLGPAGKVMDQARPELGYRSGLIDAIEDAFKFVRCHRSFPAEPWFTIAAARDTLCARNAKTREATMVVRLIACVLLASLYSGAALAQTKSGSSSTPAAGSSRTEAPVGHRQPRASDIPNPDSMERKLTEAEKAGNARLDRALRGVCRGC